MSNRCWIAAKSTPEGGRARWIRGWGPGGLCLIAPSQIWWNLGVRLFDLPGKHQKFRGEFRQNFPRNFISKFASFFGNFIQQKGGVNLSLFIFYFFRVFSLRGISFFLSIFQDRPSAEHSSWWIFILRAWILSWIFVWVFSVHFLGPSFPLNEFGQSKQKSTAKFTTKSLPNPGMWWKTASDNPLCRKRGPIFPFFSKDLGGSVGM